MEAQEYEQLVKALRRCASVERCEGRCEMNYGSTDCESRLEMDAAAAIEALQAEVNRMKDSNEELREKQTYIDHYGNKWMTSAKDVPTAAYEHGYADGLDEARTKKEVQE